MLSAADYYPFGMEMPYQNLNFSTYRYGFNGKEKDSDGEIGGSLTTYDYGFRIYNPAIAKFLSVDPLMKSYPMLTPYQFASNNPIFNIDVDGREGEPGAERMIRQQLSSKLATMSNERVDYTYQKIMKAEGDKTAYAGYAAIIPLVGAITTEFAMANWVYILYNPYFHNEVAAGVYGVFADDEWPLPAAGDNISKTGKNIAKRIVAAAPEIVTKGGLRSRWIKSFGALPNNIEVHHIIPDALKNHPTFKNSGLDIDDVFNGIPLPKYSPARGLDEGLHATHPQYNDFVKVQLDEIGQLPLSKQGVQKEISNLRNELIQHIETAGSEGKTINEYFKSLNGTE